MDRRACRAVACHRPDPGTGHGLDPGADRGLPRPHPRCPRPAVRALPPHRLPRPPPR
jgi:hypothetical protein